MAEQTSKGSRLAALAITLVVGAAVGLLVGAALGLMVGVKWSEPLAHALGLHSSESPTTAEAGKKQLWTCGMHPQVIQDHPGNCPICGMALEPLKMDNASPGAGHNTGAISIDPVVVQNMGVRVAPVAIGPVRRHIRAVGTLEEAQPNIRDINLRVSGWIEKLYADTEGIHVTKGQPLFELYSPDVQVAVEELIIAHRAAQRQGPTTESSSRQTTQTVYEAARRKLDKWGIDADQIDRIAKMEQAPRTVQFTSPMDGHIVEKMVVEGAAVEAGQRALRIVDHSTLWLDAQIHAQDQPFIKIGQEVKATIEGVPGQTFTGKAIFVHPHIDPMTRTARLRIAVPNPELTLRPGMYATVQIEAELAQDATLVPREAILDTGERQVAFVSLDTGHFEPRQVKLGASSDDGTVQVLEGVKPGESIVLSGQFLMDSESRMREAIQKHLSGQLLAKPEAPAAPAIAGSAEWRNAVDRALREYLSIADALGAVEKPEQPPVDSAKLLDAAKALLEHADKDEQKALVHPLIHSTESLGGKPLEQQRQSFKAVSEATIALASRSAPSSAVAEKLYLWHCPMAPGSWLQSTDTAANPYYATTMKQCAELKQTLAASK